jgi:transposase InsO family protein
LPKGAKVAQVTSLDLVRRVFRRDGPNQLWMTDIAEHPTREGKVYCDGRVLLGADAGRALQPQTLETRVELATAIHDYIELFHNTRRRHSALGLLTPTEYEDLHNATRQAT